MATGTSEASYDGEMAAVDDKADSVDEALRTVIYDATEEFGFAPRDAYNAIIKPSGTRKEHAKAVTKLTYSDLMAFVKTFADDCELSRVSHLIVAVSPHQSEPNCDRWTINFKSPRIAKEVVQKMRLLE